MYGTCSEILIVLCNHVCSVVLQSLLAFLDLCKDWGVCEWHVYLLCPAFVSVTSNVLLPVAFAAFLWFYPFVFYDNEVLHDQPETGRILPISVTFYPESVESYQFFSTNF